MPDPEESPGPTARRRVKRETLPGATEKVSDIVAERLASAKHAAAEHRRRVELEKLAHNQELELEDALLRRRKEWVLLWAILALGAFLTLACGVILFMPGSSTGLREKALTGLFGLITAALGFVAGKGSRKE